MCKIGKEGSNLPQSGGEEVYDFHIPSIYKNVHHRMLRNPLTGEHISILWPDNWGVLKGASNKSKYRVLVQQVCGDSTKDTSN